MRVMVVGAAGFLGSHLVDRLIAEGHTVDGVDNLSTGTLANLADARSSGGLKFDTVDVGSAEFSELVALRQPEVIVHLGWLPPGLPAHPALAGVAVSGMLNVLEAARQHPPIKVVTAVPAARLYGEVAARDLPLKESAPWQPVGVRGVLARTLLELLGQYREEHAVEYTALAMGSVYGRRQRPNGGAVAAFAEAMARRSAPGVDGDGRQSRDFVYVDDAVDAIAKALTRGGGLVVNVGTGVATRIIDLIETMSTPEAKRPVASGDPGGVSRCALSSTRARIHLSWASWTTLADGLRTIGAPPAD
jgi:UDP-glucose 4-epimerase